MTTAIIIVILALFVVIVDCGPPPALENGFVRSDNNLEGSVANYFCNFGFRLDGDDQRACQANKTWSGVIPTCICEY